MNISAPKLHKKLILGTCLLFFLLLLLALPASADTKASLEIVSTERHYDSVDNPIISKKSPDFKLGKGMVTTTYEISSYPASGLSVGWGRVDEETYIPYFYFKSRKTIPESGPIVGQPYKEVNTFEVTQSLGDMLFSAWLNAPVACESFQSCHRGTQLAAKQKFTIDFQPSGESADARTTAKKWNSKGNDLARQGSYGEAIENYEKAIDIDPNYAAPWSNIGACLLNQGKYRDAIEYFNKALDIDRNYANAWCGMGRAYKKLGNDDWAAKDIAKARELGLKC